jgi:tRNA pseudouridine38-40 synthase
MRIKLTIEYNGTGFCGWQKQKNRRSVQETVEHAIGKVLGGREDISLYGAGRTDAGVHALGQVAHFDINDDDLADKWRMNISRLPRAINFYLMDSAISVCAAQVVDDSFHARFSAKMRYYKYVIYNHDVKSAIYDQTSWHISKVLDVPKMHEAALLFLGTHDLKSFCSVCCHGKNTKRTISDIGLTRNGDFVILEIGAKSFLHNQVRITIGTLVQIGLLKHPSSYIKLLLESQDRTMAGPTAPPHGLFLNKILYE